MIRIRKLQCEFRDKFGHVCPTHAALRLTPLVLGTGAHRWNLCMVHAEIMLHAANHVARQKLNVAPVIISYSEDFQTAINYFQRRT